MKAIDAKKHISQPKKVCSFKKGSEAQTRDGAPCGENVQREGRAISMKQKKYVSSGGLAFSEEKDMKKLSKYAKKGWILEGFAPFGYRLQKGEPATIQYSLDYQMDADEDYFAYFEAAGWSHVCSSGNS